MATHDFELIERFPHRTLYCDKGQVRDPCRKYVNFYRRTFYLNCAAP